MISLGNLNINDIRLGDAQIKKVYLGNEPVYELKTGYPKPPYPEGLPIYEVKTRADWDDSKYPQEPFVLLVSGDVDVPVDTFSENQYVQYVDIENGSSIMASAFSSCLNLETVYIGNTVQTIGVASFSGCMILGEVVIGNGVTTIGSYAFASCPVLKSLIIGKSVREIGGSAFSNNHSLKCIYFYGNTEPTIVGESAFSNVFAQVMVKSTYKDKTFGLLDVTTSTVEGCPVM